MQLATAMNLRKAMDEETKRERFASWYSTLPGIPAHEKEIIERSLKYNVWKELIKLFVVYMILSLVWFFGAGQYDPFESVTGYSLIEKKSVIGVVQEDGESLRLKNPNKGEHVSYTLAELGMDPIKYSYGSRFQTYWEKEWGISVTCGIAGKAGIENRRSLLWRNGSRIFCNSYWRDLCVFYPEKTIYRMVFIVLLQAGKVLLRIWCMAEIQC